MKIEITSGVVLDNGQTSKAGDKVEVSDKFGASLIKSGKAKKVAVKKRAAKKSEDKE